jgi:hypothetical protein
VTADQWNAIGVYGLLIICPLIPMVAILVIMAEGAYHGD